MNQTHWSIKSNLLQIGGASIGLLYKTDIFTGLSDISAFGKNASLIDIDDIKSLLNDDDDNLVQIMHKPCNHCNKPVPLVKSNAIGVCESCMSLFHDEMNGSKGVNLTANNEFYIRHAITDWEGIIGFKSGSLFVKDHLIMDVMDYKNTKATLFQYDTRNPDDEYKKHLHENMVAGDEVIATLVNGDVVSVLCDIKGPAHVHQLLAFYTFIKTLYSANPLPPV